MSGARNLHRIAGVIQRLAIEALEGECSLASCTEPAAGFIQDVLTLRSKGVCERHIPGAVERGYVVHRREEIQ